MRYTEKQLHSILEFHMRNGLRVVDIEGNIHEVISIQPELIGKICRITLKGEDGIERLTTTSLKSFLEFHRPMLKEAGDCVLISGFGLPRLRFDKGEFFKVIECFNKQSSVYQTCDGANVCCQKQGLDFSGICSFFDEKRFEETASILEDVNNNSVKKQGLDVQIDLVKNQITVEEHSEHDDNRINGSVTDYSKIGVKEQSPELHSQWFETVSDYITYMQRITADLYSYKFSEVEDAGTKQVFVREGDANVKVELTTYMFDEKISISVNKSFKAKFLKLNETIDATSIVELPLSVEQLVNLADYAVNLVTCKK